MKKFDPSLPIVFIHMEKNGGTTVSHVLDQMCPPGRAFREHADRHKLEDGTFDKKDYDIYNGHLFFPKIHCFLKKKANYITTIRDPLDRFLSFYYWHKKRPESIFHSHANKMDISDFFNFFVYEYKNDSGWFNIINQQCYQLCGEQNFEFAKKTINRNFCILSVTEFNLLLIKIIGIEKNWDFSSLVYRKKAKNRTIKEYLPQEFTSKIYTTFLEDLKLYNYAKQTFLSRISTYNDKELFREIDISYEFVEEI